MEEMVYEFYNEHKSAYIEWTHGDPVKHWIGSDGDLCIMYDDGMWWHYRSDNGKVAWW